MIEIFPSKGIFLINIFLRIFLGLSLAVLVGFLFYSSDMLISGFSEIVTKSFNYLIPRVWVVSCVRLFVAFLLCLPIALVSKHKAVWFGAVAGGSPVVFF